MQEYFFAWERIKIKQNKKPSDTNMPQTFHILQPKHTLLKQDEIEKLLEKYNISLSQLPKIKINDAAIPEKANVGDVVKIERKEGGGKIAVYYRVVVL